MLALIVLTLQEIPEFKTIYDAQNYFAASKASFWNFYQDYKPYTDPSDWLPPFQGMSVKCVSFSALLKKSFGAQLKP